MLCIWKEFAGCYWVHAIINHVYLLNCQIICVIDWLASKMYSHTNGLLRCCCCLLLFEETLVLLKLSHKTWVRLCNRPHFLNLCALWCSPSSICVRCKGEEKEEIERQRGRKRGQKAKERSVACSARTRIVQDTRRETRSRGARGGIQGGWPGTRPAWPNSFHGPWDRQQVLWSTAIYPWSSAQEHLPVHVREQASCQISNYTNACHGTN